LNDVDPVDFLRTLVEIFRRVSTLNDDPVRRVFDATADELEARADQLEALLPERRDETPESGARRVLEGTILKPN